MIHFNSITAVYDVSATGQIIPLVIGLATLWKTLIAIFNRFLFDKEDVVAKAKTPDQSGGPSNLPGHEMSKMASGGPTGEGANQKVFQNQADEISESPIT